MSLNILKKNVYTGSMKGMRYRLQKTGEKPEQKILVHIWPEPFCFEKTEEDKKISQEFEFSQAGKEQIVAWLNRQYQEKKQLWTEDIQDGK